jgi:hypothetical protein
MSEPTDQILSAIAHELTGLVAANCCAKTGGRGGPAAGKHCECRETALDVYRAAAPLIEATALRRGKTNFLSAVEQCAALLEGEQAGSATVSFDVKNGRCFVKLTVETVP